MLDLTPRAIYNMHLSEVERWWFRLEMLAAEIISILTDLGMDAFSGFYGKFKLYRIKKKLHSNLHKEIFLRYGDEVYYHDLDCFLSKNKVIYNIIINCESTFAP